MQGSARTQIGRVQPYKYKINIFQDMLREEEKEREREREKF